MEMCTNGSHSYSCEYSHLTEVLGFQVHLDPKFAKLPLSIYINIDVGKWSGKTTPQIN